MITIQQDTREQKNKHNNILKYFEQNNIKVVRSKMYVGDYTRLDKQDVVIDVKKDLQEVYSNIIQSNLRFKNECVRAKDAGIKLIILVADENIQDVEQVHTWENERLKKWEYINKAHQNGKMLYKKISKKPPVSSEQLERAMKTMSWRYGVEFKFCKKEDMGKCIIELLNGD
jgi:paraquat-inducible protein B